MEKKLLYVQLSAIFLLLISLWGTWSYHHDAPPYIVGLLDGFSPDNTRNTFNLGALFQVFVNLLVALGLPFLIFICTWYGNKKPLLYAMGTVIATLSLAIVYGVTTIARDPCAFTYFGTCSKPLQQILTLGYGPILAGCALAVIDAAFAYATVRFLFARDGRKRIKG